MFSVSSTPKAKRCVHLPLEFVLFSVSVKYLKEIVDSRVVQSGKHVCEEVHREQTSPGIRNDSEHVWFGKQGWWGRDLEVLGRHCWNPSWGIFSSPRSNKLHLQCKQTFISSCLPVTPSLLCLFVLLSSLHLIPLWPRTRAMATVVKLEVLMDEGLPGVSDNCGVLQGHTVSGTLQTL